MTMALRKWLNKIGIQIIKPHKMLIQHTDLFVLLEITPDNVVFTQPMTLEYISEHVTRTYKDQPLNYFNEMGRLKLVHLRSGTVKNVSLKIDF